MVACTAQLGARSPQLGAARAPHFRAPPSRLGGAPHPNFGRGRPTSRPNLDARDPMGARTWVTSVASWGAKWGGVAPQLGGRGAPTATPCHLVNEPVLPRDQRKDSKRASCHERQCTSCKLQGECARVGPRSVGHWGRDS